MFSRTGYTIKSADMEAFTRVLIDYEELTGNDKAKQAETLRILFNAFLTVLRADIPAFQVHEYAVASLPLFTQAANIHLALLSDGIRNWEAWGFTERYRNDLQQQFDRLTVSSSKRIRAAVRDQDEPSDLDTIKECIAIGEAAGWDAKLIDTWKAALETLSKATALSRRATLTYPAYAKEYYEKGRTMIKPYTSSWEGSDKGLSEALALNALSDYDATMIKNVLTYAEFWPYLTGKEMPESAKLALAVYSKAPPVPEPAPACLRLALPSLPIPGVKPSLASGQELRQPASTKGAAGLGWAWVN